MSEKRSVEFRRRDVLKTSAMALGGALLVGDSRDVYPKAVNTNSSPSTLKITDLRVATVVKPGQVPVLSFGSIPISLYMDWEKCGMVRARRMPFS